MKGSLRPVILLAAAAAAFALAACAPRFDMTGEEATGDPIANKRVGQEPRAQ